MDFPKDPKPWPEEMVRTYVETCAKCFALVICLVAEKIWGKGVF